MRETFEVQTQDEGDVAGSARAYRVIASGELDSASAPTLGEEFERLMRAGATLVIIDATRLDFLDSSGIRVLIAAGNALEARGGRLCIDGMSGAVERVLEITGLLERYRRTPPE